MFTKGKKVAVKFTYSLDGISGSSKSVPLKDGELYEHLKELSERHGKLVIEFTDDDTLYVTSANSVKHNRVEERLEDVSEMLRQYVRGQAVSMEAYAVFEKDALKGVFGNESHAELKARSLKKNDNDEDIHVKPIEVGSFNNFE